MARTEENKGIKGSWDAVERSNLYLIRVLDLEERLEHRGVFEDQINGQEFL